MGATKEYAAEFPTEVREAAKSLSSDNHFAVLALLIHNDGMAFNQIKKELSDLHQQSLTNVLSKLQEGGFVIRKEIVEDGSNFSTQYEVTKLGNRVLGNLLDAFEPQKENYNPEMEIFGEGYDDSSNHYNKGSGKVATSSTSSTLDSASTIGGLRGQQFDERDAKP